MTTETQSAETKPKKAKKAKPVTKRGKLLRGIKWLFGLGLVGGLCGLLVAAVLYIAWTRDLPTLQALREYKPAQMTRVHAGDGKLIAEYATEHRVFVPIESIPKELQHAFVATEDQRFYRHGGWDPIGLTRAAIMAIPSKLQGKRIGGTSTITQQVAKNFLVGDDYSIKRKVREIAIARRMEKALTKDRIIELYLNDIYFGERSYGIAAAALNYFGKSMDELTVGEMAYMALLPKGPNNYKLDNPATLERAMNRRAYTLGRMVEDGYITQDIADKAKVEPLIGVDRLSGEQYLAAEYFVEEARRKIFDIYGKDELYSGGLSIRTTLDTTMQLQARRAVRDGLEAFDKRHGYRGPLNKDGESIDVSGDWVTALNELTPPRDIENWRMAVVLSAGKAKADLGFAFVDDKDTIDRSDDMLVEQKGTLALADMSWARKDLPNGPGVGPEVKAVSEVLKAGDVILVSPKKTEGTYALQQIPNVNGGLVAMDPHTGRVLALVGGYSFAQSQFNRATQAYRQPGSAFKPFVYVAALDNGFTPVSQILDAPFVIEHSDRSACLTPEELEAEEQAVAALDPTSEQDAAAARAQEPCFYKPENYSDKFYGLSTMRLGIEKSRNAMTVRLANDMGMRPVIDYGKRFGIYDDVKSELAWALGAGETTVWRLSGAYASLVNGGKAVQPRLIDRVQDKDGKTIYRPDDRACLECQIEEWDNSEPPVLPDAREQVVNPVTAYQMTSMLEGTVERGTGAGLRQLGRPLAGKTGTTNDEIDAWFMGFSPDLVVGVYVGYDAPAPMAETGAKAALPIFRSFMRDALEGTPAVPFRIPEGVLLAPVDATSGEPSFIGAPNTILEAFRPGTEPRLGSVSDTIRIGGGTDSFIGGYTGFGGGNNTDEFDVNDLIAAGERQQEGMDESENAIDPLTGEIAIGGDDDAAGNIEATSPPAPQPDPRPEPENVLDDGLY